MRVMMGMTRVIVGVLVLSLPIAACNSERGASMPPRLTHVESKRSTQVDKPDQRFVASSSTAPAPQAKPVPEKASAYAIGREDAKRDIASGILACESYGLPAPWASEYERILRERYKVQLRYVAGCIVEPDQVEHAKGYNEISRPEIERRYGADVFARVASEAQYAEKSAKSTK